MSTHTFDQVTEFSQDYTNSTNVDVVELLSQQDTSKCGITNDLPDLEIVDSNDTENSNENDWLRDGSIDEADQLALEQIFSMFGEDVALNKINGQLKENGSNFRLRIGESNGDQLTLELVELNLSKCGSSESVVDSTEIERPDIKPEDEKKPVPEKKPAPDLLEKEPLPDLLEKEPAPEQPDKKPAPEQLDKKSDSDEFSKECSIEFESFIKALEDGSFDACEGDYIEENMTSLNHRFSLAGEDHFITVTNDYLSENGHRYRLRAANNPIKWPGHRRLELVDTHNPGMNDVADFYDYFIPNAQRW